MKDAFAARFVVFGTLLCSLASCNPLAVEITPGVSLQLAEQRAAAISRLSYRLQFSIPEQIDQDIAGRIEISFDLSDNSVPLQLDFRESADKVQSVVSNGTASDYQFENEHIVIPAAELSLGSNEIRIDFVAGSTSLNRNPEYLYTLFVPDRARTTFPLFDQPDLKANYELTLITPADWQAMSNAAVASIVETEETREYRFRPSDLISSYLFSFVAGKFETVTQERNGRSMTLFHRETDEEKVNRNIDDVFDLHAASIEWLEAYSGIDFPFQKFDFALIPSFQYGGMEHVGAIQYRASSLFLDEAPSDTDLLGRAGLIAHETAHTWFGNLVTMEWFNDVWTKEVFASFMSAKIVNPSFPNINHDLNFLVRQLEALIGEEIFRNGMQEYLQRFSFANATWPALIDILDEKTDDDLRAWSEVWVNTAGRPEMEEQWETTTEGEGGHYLIQYDPSGEERVWPQQFEIMSSSTTEIKRYPVVSAATATPLDNMRAAAVESVIFNSDGMGYGLFPADMDNLANWNGLGDVARASELISLYENLLASGTPTAGDYFLALQDIVAEEENQLILNLALNQLTTIYWNLLSNEKQQEFAAALQDVLWQSMLEQTESSMTKVYFDAFVDIANTEEGVQKVYDVWSGELTTENLKLSENEFIDIAESLAIKMPADADQIIGAQFEKTQNPDNQRKLRYLAPSLSAEETVRDTFFYSLADEKNREIETWVLDALMNLHHPLRTEQSEKYLLSSLELLQEIQITGDVFFPTMWLDATLANHRSSSAVQTINSFLEERPDYNDQLRMKILQSADPMFRAHTIVDTDQPD